MKPSKYILDKFVELNLSKKGEIKSTVGVQNTIIAYLDEERERVNGILHEIVKNCGVYWVGGDNNLHNLIDELSDSAAKGSE